jgi:hypothetical protein
LFYFITPYVFVLVGLTHVNCQHFYNIYPINMASTVISWETVSRIPPSQPTPPDSSSDDEVDLTPQELFNTFGKFRCKICGLIIFKCPLCKLLMKTVSPHGCKNRYLETNLSKHFVTYIGSLILNGVCDVTTGNPHKLERQDWDSPPHQFRQYVQHQEDHPV